MANANLAIKDANSVSQNMRTVQNGDGSYSGTMILADPITEVQGKISVNGEQRVNSEGVRATYRYAAPAIAPGATPSDFLLIQGSASKTIRVKRVALSGNTATATWSLVASLVRYTGAPTGGTPVTVTAAKHDTTDGAATAVVKHFTAAPTAGTGGGNLGAMRFGNANPALKWNFATRQDKAIILRGVADWLAVNFAGAAVPGDMVFDYEIEIEEDAS